MSSSDPVHQDETDSQWYFWDEVWADRYGPYTTEEECRKSLASYCVYLNRCHYPVADGQPCNHPGCASHVTHPCEGCNRKGARGSYDPNPVLILDA